MSETRRRGLRRSRWARVAAWVGGGVVGLFVVWLAAVNAVLAFGGVEALVTRENAYTRIHLEHGRAWMLWPTRVHVHDATIRIDTLSYEFEAKVSEAVVDIRLLSLFSRRFHAQRIEAHDVDALYRQKVDAATADSPRLAAFPPFEDTPPEVKSAVTKPQPERDDAWGIDLDDVDAEVASLWVDEFNTTPFGHVRGGLHWTDGYEFEVATTTVQLESASLWIGEHEAMRGIDGEGTVTLAPFETKEVEGTEVPGYLSFDVELAAEVREPAAMAIYAPEQLEGHIHGGEGSIAAALSVRDGVFQPGSAVHYATDRIDFTEGKARVRSASDVHMEVTGEGHPRIAVEVTDAQLVVGDGVAARIPMARASLTADQASMMEPWEMIAAHAEAPDIRVDELRAISELHPTKHFRFTGGSAQGRIVAELDDDGALASVVSSTVRGAAMTMKDVRVTTTGSTRARIRFAKGGTVTIDRVRVALQELALTTPKGTSSGTWARIDDATIRIRKGDTAFDVRGKVEDARPAIIHTTKLDPLVRAIPDLGHVRQPITVEMTMRVRPRALDIEIEKAEQLGLHMQGAWRLRDKHWRSAFLFSGTAALGFASDDRGLLQIVPAGDGWLAKRLVWVRSLAGHRDDARSPASAQPRR